MKASEDAIARAKLEAKRFRIPVVVVRMSSGAELVINESLARRWKRIATPLATVEVDGSVIEFAEQVEGAKAA